MTSGIKNKIVTSVYDLNYINERGGAIYKGFDLLTKTIRGIIFPNYEYVVYTDKLTYEKHNLSKVFNQPNVQIKFHELNGELYTTVVNPLRLKKIESGNIWDRIHSVNNYVEVMYNKFEFLLRESENFDGNVAWVDAGLFGTSCAGAWRNYMGEIAHSELFVEKLFEKIEEHGIISLKGNSIIMNYEDRDRINNLFGVNCFIVPGGLFGGKSSLVKNCFSDYKEIIKKMVESNFYTSDQEILCITISKQDKKMFFEHNDWDDLQRGVLKIMDLYDEQKYQTNEIYEVNLPKTKIMNYELKQRTNREILNEILNVSTTYLDSLDLSKYDSTLNQMSGFALYFKDKAGLNHYRLLTFISNLLINELVLDIGADNGCSGLALSDNKTLTINSYDVVFREEISKINEPNFQYFIENILATTPEKLHQSRFIMLDTFHDGIFEHEFYNHLINTNYKGLLFLDDIHLNEPMENFWASISHEKYDLTRIGHSTGSGIVIFE